MGNQLTTKSQQKILFCNGKFLTTDQQLTCAHCKGWLVKPVQSVNGHRFCEVCYLQLREIGRDCKDCKKDGISPAKHCTKLKQKYFNSDKGIVLDRYKMIAKCVDCDLVANCRIMVKMHAAKPCKKRSCYFMCCI